MVFLDSGFFIAWAVKNDQFHSASQDILKQFVKTKPRLFTSNYVIQEAITRIVYNAGVRAAKPVINKLTEFEKKGLLSIIWVDRLLHQESINALYKYQDHPFSFVDASIIAVVKHLKLKAIYTTDASLKRSGLNIVLLEK